MNFITAVAYILLFSFLLGLVLPWWIFVVPCFIAGFFGDFKFYHSFLSGLLAMFLVWGGYATYIYVTADSLLPQQIADLFNIDPAWILIIGSALLAGMVGGFGALAGHYLKLVVDR